MRYRTVQRVALFLSACGAAVYLGCAAPMPCSVTPVNIEEIKSDIRDLDKELAEKKGVLTKLEADIVDLEADLAKKKLRVPTLQAQLDSLKQASGRTERPESTATDTTRTMSGSGF